MVRTQVLDAGKASHSPSAELMELVDVDHTNDFEEVVRFLKENLDKVIKEVHGFDKLLVDNSKTQLNCPPPPAKGDRRHGNLLLRTLSEAEGSGGITFKREFKVHNCGVDPDDDEKHKVEIREDSMKAPDEAGKPPIMTENVVVISIVRDL
jgi:hypothetical protein